MYFGTGRGVTKGEPAYSMIFNIVVDLGVRAFLEVVCGPQEARHGMGWAAGECNLVFYADDGWVKNALTVTVAMFRRVVIETNLENTKALVCTPGCIWDKCIKAAYKRRATGEGDTFRERKRSRVSCS